MHGETMETRMALLEHRMEAIEVDRESAAADRKRIEGLARATFDKMTALENQALGGRKVLALLIGAAAFAGPAIGWAAAKFWSLALKP